MDDVDLLMANLISKIDIVLEECANDLLEKSLAEAPEGQDVVLKKSGIKIHSGGTLKRSAFVEARHESEDVRCFVVGYDTRRENPSDTINYALVRHEKESPHWKFLEHPYLASIEEYREKLAEVISEEGSYTVSGEIIH